MDAVYPPAASALARGRRRLRAEPRARRRTLPVTFAEIKEVDEEKDVNEEANGTSVASVASAAEERRRRPDLLDERLGREFAEFRRRRARRHLLHEPDEAAVSSSPPDEAAVSSSPLDEAAVPSSPPDEAAVPTSTPGAPLVLRAASEPRPASEPS